ncbi:MAG TPA: PepSY-associated TM helix domain-containing protein [Polyangiaceae bacterium]|nr:PepSY-associated TM helix domain-containing protein [Polyangiaceae bacterium]
MRKVLVFLHRWFGLGLALFLFQAGLTGALIAWDHEIDGLFNPELYRAETPAGAELLSPLRLAEIVERDDPRVQVTFLPLAVEPGHALMMSVDPRKDAATGKPYELDFDQVAVNPATGEVQGRREWGAISLSRQQVMPFLYKLHYSLHLPEAGGISLGLWFMGLVAMVWFFDAFIALWISFPNRKAWKKSFAFRFDKGGYRLNFDLHRSGGVWTWLLLMPLAFTAVSMNLNREVVRPLVSAFSPLADNPFASRTQLAELAVPAVSRAKVIELGAAEGLRLELERPIGGLFYSPEFDVFGVGFYAPGNDHGDGGLGNPWLYFDGQTGAAAGSELPGRGSAGDFFMQLQFPLHSGRILGVPGRVLITLLGLVVAMLSVTGVIIWAKKRRVRVLADAKEPRGERAPASEIEIQPSA